MSKNQIAEIEEEFVDYESGEIVEGEIKNYRSLVFFRLLGRFFESNSLLSPLETHRMVEELKNEPESSNKIVSFFDGLLESKFGLLLQGPLFLMLQNLMNGLSQSADTDTTLAEIEASLLQRIKNNIQEREN